MTTTDQTLENLTLTINQEIHVKAPLDVTFAALLEQLGPGNETPDGKSMNMKIEAWPGGRWYRDLGDGNGHFWAHCPGHQAAHAARILRSFVRVFPARFERAIPAERSGWRNLDRLPPHRARLRFRRSPRRHGQRLDLDARTCSQARGSRLKASRIAIQRPLNPRSVPCARYA